MGEGDGVYYSESAAPPSASGGRVARAAKKAAVAFAGLGAVGAGAYFGTAFLTGDRPGPVPGEPAAIAPVAPAQSASVPPSIAVGPAEPSPGPQFGTKSGVRQSVLPSPTPSASPSAPLSAPGLTDPEVAAGEVDRLLQAAPQAAPSSVTIASGPVTVATDRGTDGSAIRVVSARYDLTGRWAPPAPGDRGQAVGNARCTQNFQVAPDAAPQLRPSMLLCWRTGPGRSVVTVAISRTGRPLAAASVAVLDRQWSAPS